VTNRQAFLNEQGKVFLEFDDHGRLERERLYAGQLDHLLAVEDFDFVTSSVPDEVVWTLADDKRTTRDLLGVGQAAGQRQSRHEHLFFDSFGLPRGREMPPEDTALSDLLGVGQGGMEFDFDGAVYFMQGRVYEPSSGRYVNVPIGPGAKDSLNVYTRLGIDPVHRGSQGKPAAVNPVQAASRIGYWEAFGETYQVLNPAWKQEAILLGVLLAPIPVVG
jgi:hypothetical protein